MSIILGLLKYWKYLLAGALIASAGIYGDIHGHKVEKADQVAATAANTKKDVAIGQTVVTQYIDRVKIVHDKTKPIIVKVPVYVTAKDDADCTINNGFVSLWNDSNRLQSPGAPSTTDEDPSGIELSDVAKQHAVESEYTHDLEQQVTGLQDYVKGITK